MEELDRLLRGIAELSPTLNSYSSASSNTTPPLPPHPPASTPPSVQSLEMDVDPLPLTPRSATRVSTQTNQVGRQRATPSTPPIPARNFDWGSDASSLPSFYSGTSSRSSAPTSFSRESQVNLHSTTASGASNHNLRGQHGQAGLSRSRQPSGTSRMDDYRASISTLPQYETASTYEQHMTLDRTISERSGPEQRSVTSSHPAHTPAAGSEETLRRRQPTAWPPDPGIPPNPEAFLYRRSVVAPELVAPARATLSQHETFEKETFRNTAILCDVRGQLVEYTSLIETEDSWKPPEYEMVEAARACRICVVRRRDSLPDGALRFTTSIWAFSDDRQVRLQQKRKSLVSCTSVLYANLSI